MPEDWEAGGFGIYVHWPFCAAKCPYCDFNSHVSDAVDHDRWRRAYLAALDRLAEPLAGRRVASVFFGGGTPSLMDPATVGAVLDRIARTWDLAGDVEITLEANPTSVEARRFRDFRAAGINRVSVGVQALEDDALRRLGRLHTASEALDALQVARATFDRVSFDLIYARQDQTKADWRRELDRALAMGPDHLSAYQLTIEPGTAFGERFARGRLRGLPDEDRAADLWDVTQELTGQAGLPAYEVSNHARPGAQSRHNLIYWRAGDYLGLGPGAHGRLTIGAERWATETALRPQDWLARVETGGTGETRRTALSRSEQGEEYLMMALRLAEGVDVARLERLGVTLPHAPVRELQDLGLAHLTGDRYRATAEGRLVLNGILRRLAA